MPDSETSKGNKMKISHIFMSITATLATLCMTVPTTPMAHGTPVQNSADEAADVSATNGAYEFSTYLQELSAAMPDAIVDHQWLHDHGAVWVTKDGLSKAAESASARAIKIFVHEANPDAIPANRRAKVESAAIEFARGRGIEATGATYSPQNNEIVLSGRMDASTAHEIMLSSMRASVTLQGFTPSQSPRIRYVHDAAPLPVPAYLGGKPYSGCTAGFVARREGQQGITTAAHCFTKPATYDGQRTGTTWMASNQRDVRFTSILSGTAEPKFQYKAGQYRTVTSLGVVSPGMTIFKYGKTTGYGQATINKYEGCRKYTDGRTWCGLYSTTRKVIAPGDSGGPWFVAGKALGYTSGTTSTSSLMTPQAEFHSVSGATEIVVQR